MEYKDYYKILGIDKNASEVQIKSAYRKLAKKYHPDVAKTAKDSEKFKEINEAYEVLSDKEKKLRYDSLGSNWQAGANFDPPPGSWSGFGFSSGSSGQRRRSSHTSSFQDFGDLGGFSDFFKAIFGDLGARTQQNFYSNQQQNFSSRQNFQSSQAQNPKENLDLNQIIEVSAKDLFSDKPIKVKISNIEKCNKCSSVGSVCYVCGGTGIVNNSKILNVRIPKGVKEGQKIRIQNEGKSSNYVKGKKGNVYLTVKFKDSEYKIDGANLTKQIEILPFEAALGAKKEIETLHGKIGIKIPPMTHSSQILRLKDLGLAKKSGGFGVLNLHILINIEQNLSQDQLKLYESLKTKYEKLAK